MTMKIDLATVDGTGLPKTVFFDDGKLKISFKRTVRVPDVKDAVFQLPPDLGNFPLFPIIQYADKLPVQMAWKGGVFISMYQREAMWIDFEHCGGNGPICCYLIKIYVGGINAVSGELGCYSNTDKQSFVNVPSQKWIDGIAVRPGVVRQFVALPIGSGATVEGQMTGQEQIGGLQIEVMPVIGFEIVVKTLTEKRIPLIVAPKMTVGELKDLVRAKEGIPPDQIRLVFKGKQLMDTGTMDDYKIAQGSELRPVQRLRGGGRGKKLPPSYAMGLGAGGMIKQYIQPTKLEWDPKAITTKLNLQILNSMTFREITGRSPLKAPISMKKYAKTGGKFFDIPEKSSDVNGSFDNLNEGDGDDETDWRENFEDWSKYKSLT